jgi:hypothetical protein
MIKAIAIIKAKAQRMFNVIVFRLAGEPAFQAHNYNIELGRNHTLSKDKSICHTLDKLEFSSLV